MTVVAQITEAPGELQIGVPELDQVVRERRGAGAVAAAARRWPGECCRRDGELEREAGARLGKAHGLALIRSLFPGLFF